MKSFNKKIGYYGENIAKEYLIKNGYNIICKNYSNRFGEIDIICKKYDILCFVEVKSRYNKNYGSAIESITYKKIQNIKKLTKYFLLSNNYKNFFIRFDVLEIYFNTKNNNYNIIYTKDAFR
ncbi:YraN family protein [Clostridium sp.]|uniref:YraN family protein n=1 Tax=Clostridium sp. TaxID=1506 RepID=UPI0026DAC262|nr:YraN family protein [Clostridium sp.]MDO5038192.1 YraN family protein [Clostridium sp.]